MAKLENDTQLEATQRKLAALYVLLLDIKRRVPYQQYREMAQAFMADIQRMEEEIHEYLLSAPPLEQVASSTSPR